MGVMFSREETPALGTSEEVQGIPPNNGFVFNDCYFPPEVVTHILGFLDPILNGRRVCKAWKEIIDSPSMWREKLCREVPCATYQIFDKELIWVDYYHLWRERPHKKNLIRNGSAEERFVHWTVRPVTYGGNKWKIEKEPIGCDPFPAGASSCFVTSFEWCTAEQVINLRSFGLTENFMRRVRPHIYVEEWYTGRFDCGFEYSLKVTLLSNSWDIVDSFVFHDESHTATWRKTRHCFKDYDREIAVIVFHHKGKDTQFWAGHYGAKMTGAKVYISFPGFEDPEEEPKMVLQPQVAPVPLLPPELDPDVDQIQFIFD